MYYTELVNRVLTTRDPNLAESLYAKELEELGLAFYNKNARGCGNCYIEIFIKLHKNGLEMAKKKDEQKKGTARLKEGAVISIPRIGVTMSNSNITDEMAAKALKFNAKLEKHFVVLPGEQPKNSDAMLVAADKEIEKLNEDNKLIEAENKKLTSEIEKLKKEIESFKNAK